LAAARALGRAGFHHVTVLEKSDRVGGKCHTVQHRGRSYELGAGAVTSAYHSVNRLCREVGLQQI
jgi:protoporphyrinogen oxidase